MSTTFDWRSRRTALTALIVLALAAVGGAALVRSEHATGQESGQPASSFSVFGQAGPRPTAAQAASLGDLKDPSNQAPFALDPALDRVAQQTQDSTIYARAGANGVCIRDVEKSGSGGGACAGLSTAAEAATPIIGVLHTGTGLGFRLIGLVPDSVTNVAVTLPDGSIARPDIVNNAFEQVVGSGNVGVQWSASDGSTYQAALTARDTTDKSSAASP